MYYSAMTPAKLKEGKTRIARLDRGLKKLFPDVAIELKLNTTGQLLVAVQLSAQCTEKMVNKITAELFKKYKTVDDYVRARKAAEGIVEFEKMIMLSGFYHNKAKNILA